MNFVDRRPAFRDHRRGIEVSDLVQLGKLELKDDQQLRGRIVELAGNSPALVRSGSFLVAGIPAVGILAIMVRRQTRSPQQQSGTWPA